MLAPVRVPILPLAVVAWLLLGLRWFDTAASLRPPGLGALPAWLLALPVAGGLALGLGRSAQGVAPPVK